MRSLILPSPLTLVDRARQRAEYGAMRVMAAAIRAMPLDTASATMGRIWETVAPWTKRHPRALQHIAMAMPELDEARRQEIVAGMWNNLGRVAAETLQLDRLVADRSRVVFSPQGLVTLAGAGKGAVLVSLHSANWEVVVEASNTFGLESTGVYKPLDNRLVDAWLHAMRAPLYQGGLLAKGPDTARILISRIKRGDTVAVMADLRDSRGIQVPFFGRPAYANPFPAMAARMTKAPLIAGRVRRLGGARFVIDAEEIPVSRTSDRTEDVRATTAAVHACFERWIRQRPEEWMWIHRKWDQDRAKKRLLREGAGGAPSAEDDDDDD